MWMEKSLIGTLTWQGLEKDLSYLCQELGERKIQSSYDSCRAPFSFPLLDVADPLLTFLPFSSPFYRHQNNSHCHL